MKFAVLALAFAILAVAQGLGLVRWVEREEAAGREPSRDRFPFVAVWLAVAYVLGFAACALAAVIA